jgi:asparagine synthase (glutamine-hydrolysing)
MARALRGGQQGAEVSTYSGPIGFSAIKALGHRSGSVQTVILGHVMVFAYFGSFYNVNTLFGHGASNESIGLGLLELFAKHGMKCLEQLRGDFVLALWDGSTQTCHIATDRFRVHSLVYTYDHEKLVFASKMQALLGCPLPIRRSIDPETIVSLVGESVIATPKTIFREVHKLPPGHVLSYCGRNITLSQYWDLSFLHPLQEGESQLASQLRTRLDEAISVRMENDNEIGELGTFLSGGIDSSTVTGLMTKLRGRPISSFSVGFEEESFNEIRYARIAAKAFQAKHVELFVKPCDVLGAIPILLEAFDEPFGNASAIPAYYCAKTAREHGIAVMYAGDGGDELFGGNAKYATQRLFDYYYKIPNWFREPVFRPVLESLADLTKFVLFVKGKKYIQRATTPYPDRLYAYGFFETIPAETLFTGSFLEMVPKPYDPYISLRAPYRAATAKANDELHRQLYVDLKLTISDDDLFKVTRMCEAAGVTVRFPFLDHSLVEFAASVPARIKMPGLQLRSFFKRAYADLLPIEIRSKKKQGFGLPISTWLRTDKALHDLMQDLVLSPRTLQRGYFQKQALENLVVQHRTNETSFYGTALWNLMVIELWHRKYVDNA